MFRKILSSLAKIALTTTMKVLFCAHMTRCELFGKMGEFGTVGDALATVCLYQAKAVPTIVCPNAPTAIPWGLHTHITSLYSLAQWEMRSPGPAPFELICKYFCVRWATGRYQIKEICL